MISNFFYQFCIIFQVQALYILRFIPKYFILFDVIINEIVFLNLCFECSFLVYRNATYLFMLILCPATLTISLISFSCFWCLFFFFDSGVQFITLAGPRQSLLLAKGPDQHF